MTEHLSGEDNSVNDWSRTFAVAKEMNDVMQVGMSAYVWWYIVRYYGPIDDGEWDPRYTKGTVTKKGYVMSQFSRFIRPGDYRVKCGIFPPLSNVHVTAYKDSVSSKTVIVTVNMNSSSRDLAFNIHNGTMSKYIAYTTSENKNVAQGDESNITDNRFVFTLEASSITTNVLNQ